ncbi:MAG: flagellar hook-length control protein FliK [Acidobacteria bacterium]|nr:flagellar hook-length control protein FliK [Acidobacteriota bacterium]
MDVPRVDSAQLRPASAQMMADTALDLVRGDRFAATVVALHEAGEIVLATPRGAFISQSDVRLVPGQALVLEVVRGGNAPMLRIVDGAFHFDEQAFAEAVIEAVRRHMGAERQAGRNGAPLDERQLAAALRAHINAPGAPLTQDQRAVAARLLAPLDPHAPTADIADHLRVLIENGGTQLEPHLRAALAGRPPAGPLPADVANDLRVLLAALLKPGADDTARTEARQRLSAQLANDVLERQLDQALQWVKHGVLAADVPVADGRDDRVRMEYERDARRSEGEGDRPADHSLRLAFDLEALGRLDVVVTWSGGSASMRVRTDDDETRGRVVDGLTDLRASLRARGLALQHADVVVGEAPAADVAAPSEPPPSGSILRLVG